MEFIADLDHLHQMLSWIKVQLEPMKFEKRVLHKVELASEEALANIINHAYQGRSGKVEIVVNCFETRAEIAFKDNGPSFNPLKISDPDTSLPINKREIGGLGVHLIKQCVSDLFYTRVGNKNVLIFVIRSSQKK